ncbi:hypothetical protein [Ruegeria arenilitoris]|nr:hypothetical protein [Ruegeria arenilitoris]
MTSFLGADIIPSLGRDDIGTGPCSPRYYLKIFINDLINLGVLAHC